MLSRHLQAHPGGRFGYEPQFFQPQFVVYFRRNSGGGQALLQRLGLGPIVEDCNGNPVHEAISAQNPNKSTDALARTKGLEYWSIGYHVFRTNRTARPSY